MPCVGRWPNWRTRCGAREAVGLDVDAPADLPLIRAATEAGQNLELEYLSASRDELTTRVVEPMQVITVDGHWYLDAYCHRAGDMRRFRVDRIVKAHQLDQAVSDEVRRPRPAEDMFVPGPGAYEVHLELAPDAGWVAESIPVRQVNRDGDGTGDRARRWMWPGWPGSSGCSCSSARRPVWSAHPS